MEGRATDAGLVMFPAHTAVLDDDSIQVVFHSSSQRADSDGTFPEIPTHSNCRNKPRTNDQLGDGARQLASCTDGTSMSELRRFAKGWRCRLAAADKHSSRNHDRRWLPQHANTETIHSPSQASRHEQ
ncbi:hypothetical protein EV363DRAFT_1168846 [Boletus edulis]|nr:hypothetical protein EV363DRAFT_1168846 [Boletus edulis]